MFQTELTTSTEMMYQKNSPTKCTKRRTKISSCLECIWPQSRCDRDVEISTPTGRYLPTTLIIQSLVKLSLLSWTCMTLHIGDAMERWSPQWNHWILWFHMLSDQNYVIKKYSKTLRPGKLLRLIIYLTTVGPSTYSLMSCVQSHACSWMSTAVCLSNKHMLFKNLGVFETEPVDPDILTVNAAALVPYTVAIWRYHHREYYITPESPECVFVSCNYQHMSAKDDKRMRKQAQQLLKCQNNKQMLPNVLRIFSFSQVRGLIEDGTSGWRSRYHHGLLCTWRCPFWQEYHQGTQRWHWCVGIASLFVPWQSTSVQITNAELG